MGTIKDKDLTVEDGVFEKDLTAEDGILKSAESFQRLETAGPQTEPYNHLKQQEQVRGRIAEGLAAMLAVIILFAFVTLWVYSSTFADLEKLMTIVFGPVIALVGTAIGYYFGGKTANKASNS